jgi:hypothetical protein
MRQASFGNSHCKRLAKYTIVCHHYVIFMLLIGVLVVALALPSTHCRLMGYLTLEVSSAHMMNLLEGRS